MKNLILKTISICLLMTILFSIFSGTIAFADSLEQSCMSHYFSKIQSDVPQNVKGSCVYVALSMILMFYDTYWNDSFIEDTFEADNVVRCFEDKDYPSGSPKLKLENTIIPEDEDGNDDLAAYASFVSENADDYFHLYLISLAANNVSDDDGRPLISLQDETYGIYTYEAKKLLEYYLYNVLDFSSDQIVVHIETSTGIISADSEIYQTINEKVTLGIPVFYVANNGESAHAMVAYNFNGNDIQLHKGYTSGHSISLLGEFNEYKSDVEILWLEIKDSLPHVCNSKYAFGFEQTPVCACIAYKDKHPEHVHDLTQLEPTTSTTHIRSCIWGCTKDQEEEPHSFSPNRNASDTMHIAICDCGYILSNPHNLVYEQILEYGHILTCECGYRREESHTLSYKRSSADYHIRVCDCGYSYNEEHTLTYQDYHTDACVCGYTSTTPHNFIYQEGSDENHHIAICECGYNGEVWHTWTYRSTSASYHSCICPCGYTLVGESHVFEQISIRYLKCKFCGYIRDNLGSGENIIMGTEENKEKE